MRLVILTSIKMVLFGKKVEKQTTLLEDHSVSNPNIFIGLPNWFTRGFLVLHVVPNCSKKKQSGILTKIIVYQKYRPAPSARVLTPSMVPLVAHRPRRWCRYLDYAAVLALTPRWCRYHSTRVRGPSCTHRSIPPMCIAFPSRA